MGVNGAKVDEGKIYDARNKPIQICNDNYTVMYDCYYLGLETVGLDEALLPHRILGCLLPRVH